MKRFAMGLVLSSILSSVALAGEIPSVGAPAPPPNGITQTTPPLPGEIPTSGVAEQLQTDALSALVSVLGFLTV